MTSTEVHNCILCLTCLAHYATSHSLLYYPSKQFHTLSEWNFCKQMPVQTKYLRCTKCRHSRIDGGAWWHHCFLMTSQIKKAYDVIIYSYFINIKLALCFGLLYGTVCTFFSELQNNRKSLQMFAEQKTWLLTSWATVWTVCKSLLYWKRTY